MHRRKWNFLEWLNVTTQVYMTSPISKYIRLVLTANSVELELMYLLGEHLLLKVHSVDFAARRLLLKAFRFDFFAVSSFLAYLRHQSTKIIDTIYIVGYKGTIMPVRLLKIDVWLQAFLFDMFSMSCYALDKIGMGKYLSIQLSIHLSFNLSFSFLYLFINLSIDIHT